MAPMDATSPTHHSDHQPAPDDSPPPRLRTVQDTPHATATSNPSICQDWENTQEIQDRISAELDQPGATIEGGEQFTKGLFQGEVTETQITKFLENTPHYSNGRWVGISASPTNEKDIYEPLTDICNAIFHHFKRTDRHTVLSGTMRLGHESEIGTSSQAEHIGKDKKLKSSPDLVVLGKGKPYFRDPHFPSPPNYGAQFVLWICGIASSNLTRVGFDATIYWALSRRNLDFTNAETKKKIQLFIPSDKTVFRRLTLVGRGTTCWIATTAIGSKNVLIKQYWRFIHRPPEETFLKHLKGVPGVVELLGYQHLGKVSSFRLGPHPPNFRDRMYVRILMSAHGDTIEKARTQIQLLETLLDSIKGKDIVWSYS
ncbi:hypothetical protein AX16_000880 [Volvariella volvacea WC 439]|nr:hypothetical protein AX16_000880 [Volvariella volvacea WC 439]